MAAITTNAENATVVLNGYVFTSFINGDIIQLAPVNDLTSHTNSTRRGVNINYRSDRQVHDLSLPIQRFSDDDIFLTTATNTTNPTIFNGSVKQNYIINPSTDGVETYRLENGSILTQPTNIKNNEEGNETMLYVIRFRVAVRNLG